MCGGALARATLGRLPTYLSHVRALQAAGMTHTSATAIARALGLGEVQVRKDLNAISGAGKPRTGYLIDDLIRAMEERIGAKGASRAVLVGAGKLGCALLSYDGFTAYGTEIIAAFDTDEGKQGVCENGKHIYPLSYLRDFIRENKVTTGVITVPQQAAQQVCDLLVACGVRAIWSFAPVRLQTPGDVCLRQENLALSLACLNGQRGAFADEDEAESL